MANTPLLLPAGPLTTSGNQMVDASGNPVRIACIGWSGSNGRNGVPEGLDQANYMALLDQVKSTGFNTIRLTFCDASVINNDYPASGTVNTSLNPTMAGLSCLGVHDLIVTYCGTIGLRVIIDSHNNEGANGINYGANQPNGLWYDKGGAADGTDQGGNTGTVTDANFTAMWQSVATRYKNSPAIVGYDLRNEPNTTGMNGAGNGGGSTWGDGSNRDIRAMYMRVGNAILAIDPRPLIICEGPQNYNGTFAAGTYADGIAYGTGTNFKGGSGDLTGVRTLPITLNVANKVVYSVHEYPPETSGNANDQGGQTKINQMTAIWGWIVKANLAPVWVGEMGSWFNGTAAQISSSTTWMNMMIAYCNGVASGGPSFTGVQQGIGIDWWDLAVNESGGAVPNFGYLTAWQGGVPRSNQYALYRQLFYTSTGSTPPPGGTVSPNGTIITTAGPAITDANSNTWAITAGGQIAVNGTTDATTANVIEIAYISGLIWQENAAQNWYSKSTPTDVWTQGANPIGAGPVASPNGTDITTVGPAITDANGNLWSLNSTARVVVNGTADLTLIGAVELAFVSNRIWARTASNVWYYKVLPTDTWAPTGGTATSPLTTGTPRVTAPLTGTVTTGTWVAHDITVSGVTLPSGKPVHFCTLLPSGYNTSVIYPVVIWLHPTFDTTWYNSGSGESPTGMCFYDADGFYNKVPIRTAFPAIIVVGYADQTSGNDAVDNWGGWTNNGSTGTGTHASGDTGPNVFALQGVLAWVLANMSADASRVYLEGFSLGAIGVEYNLLKYNQINGSPALYTAGMSVAGVLEIHGYGAGPSGADTTTMANVPAWFVSGAQDTTSRPANWNDPMWRNQSGNSNYPAPGGTVAQATAGSSQYHYWRDPNIGHQQTDSAGNAYPTNNTILTWLFAQYAGGSGTGGGGGTVTPPATGPANATWNIINGILAWTPSATVALGARRSNNGVAYQCVLAGTTAGTGGPAGTSGDILDGTAHWKFLATIDFLDRSGALTALPASFSSNLVWQFWNVASQTTPSGTSFLILQGHLMPAGTSLTLTGATIDSLRTYLASQSVPLVSTPAQGATFLQPLTVGTGINYTVINDPVVTLDGLAFVDPSSASGSTILQVGAVNTQLIVRNAIIDGYSQGGGANMVEIDATGTVLFTNCLFIDRQASGGTASTVVVQSSVTGARFVNCTFIAVQGGVAAGAIGSYEPGTVALNCAFFGYVAAGNNTNVLFNHCVTDTATWGAGTDSGLNVYNQTAAANFIAPGVDYRLLPSSAMIGAGVVDVTDIPAGDDIAGTPRTQGKTWDVGCWARISFSLAEIRPPPVKFW